MFSGYNAWANLCVFEACAALSEADYKADRGGFFGSIHGALSHLLVADRFWLARLKAEPMPDYRLDSQPFESFSELSIAKTADDAALRAYVQELSNERIAAEFRWTRKADGVEVVGPLWSTLAHIFNHQTHHRGQVHDLLGQAGVSPPSLDLPVFQKASGFGFSN